ncbi:TPR-like protein, partial [Peniophora sp. CONT]
VPASLPAAPSIFYGRTREANHIVDLVLDKHPARIAILGSGGIGKTTIALSVLNSRQIENTFGDRRFFLSCEAVVTADGIIQGLLKLFGLTVDHKAGVSPQDLLVSHLAALGDCILCLDNLETPWDADVQAVEALLSKVAGISDLALLITTRGADRPPRIAWTRPLLPSVVPLTLEAAIEIWDAICDSHDQHSIMLIRAVDQVPLAVTLLAHLAQSESTDSLWARWEDEQIELLRARGPGSRLTQVDISIQISLHSPRLRDEPLTLQLFSVICTLPQGLPESRIPAFVATFRDQLPHLRRSITLLKQCSLLYLSEDKYLRVLSPVRLYMHARHRIADTLLSRLVESYCDLVDFRSDRFTEEVQYAKLLISPELGNIAFVLRHCMTRGSLPLEQSLLAVNSFSRLCRDLSYYDTALLSEAIAHAGHTVPAIVAQLEQSKAECLYFQDRKDQALIVFMNARELYRSIHDRKGEAECLQRLGDTYLFHHRRTEAMHALLVALSLWSGTDGRRGQARTLRSLGRLYGSLGKANESERALKSALEVFEDIRDDLGKASAFETLGDLFLSLGRFEEAKNMLTSALALYSEINYRLGEDNALQQLGRLYLRVQKLDEGESVLRAALEIYRAVGGRMGEAKTNCLHRLGDVYLFNDRRDEALHALQASLDIWSGVEDQRGKARTLRSLGRLYNAMGRIEEGEPALWSALDIFTDTGDDLGRASTLETLSDLYIGLREDDQAYEVLQSALALYQKINFRHGEANILQNIGLLHVNVLQLAEGESALLAALDLYREIGGRMGEVHTLTALGSLYNQQQRYEDALAVLRPACEIASNISYTTGEGIAWSYLGRAHRQGGHLDDAERCLLEALQLFEKAGTPYNIEIARRDLVDLRTQRMEHQAP